MKFKQKFAILIMSCIALILFISPVQALAATVGASLPNPETGWTRYDDSDQLIKYDGQTWRKDTNISGRWMNGVAATGTKGDKITIKFNGTKFRLISEKHPDHSSLLISLDGGSQEKIVLSSTSTRILRCLVYESPELEMGVHTLTITSLDDKTGSTIIDAIDIIGNLVSVSQPMNLTATAGESIINLKWDAVDGATKYNVKRSTTANGPYTTIETVSGSAVTFTDKNVKNNNTYYYVVSSVVNNTESPNSNEASATLKVPDKKIKLVLDVNEQKQLSVTDELSDNTNMIWSSSDDTVATVDSNGLLKALKPGNAVITCNSNDGEYIETINVLVVKLDLQLAVDLNVGDKCRLTVDDLSDTANVTWKSDNPTIAEVTNKGKVTALSEGLTYITAIDSNGNEVGRIYIRVRQE